MASEALELALAVYRSPIKRHALYEMALPRDVGLVVQLASAPQPLLSEVAADVDESEHTVVEASRFYLQLALFQPDADAYRILGLPDDATHERIREHYRWLQRWVHPDRRGEDWEALFATRVNWAWSNLRNETVRRAYDLEHDRGRSTHSDAAAEPDVGRVAEWNPVLVPPHRSNRAGQIVFAAMLCSCVALLYMVLTRRDDVPPDEIGARSLQAASKIGAVVATTSDVPRAQPASMSEASGLARNSRDARQIVAGGEGANGPGESSRLADFRQSEHGAPSPASRAAPVENNAVAPKPPSPAATSSGSSVPGAGEAVQESGQSMLARRTANIADEPKMAAQASSRKLTDHDNRVAPASDPAGQIAGTAVGAEIGSNNGSPSVLARDRDPAEHAAAAPDKASLTGGGGGRSAGSADDALARIDLAHQRVKELSTFFSKFDSRLPPIWNDLTGQASAEAQRSALHERAGLHDPADFVVDDVRWRMSENSAALSANYHLLKRNSISESGRFSLSMVWRERMWLVTQVELRPIL